LNLYNFRRIEEIALSVIYWLVGPVAYFIGDYRGKTKCLQNSGWGTESTIPYGRARHKWIFQKPSVKLGHLAKDKVNWRAVVGVGNLGSIKV
jgi:hypothetical protein